MKLSPKKKSSSEKKLEETQEESSVSTTDQYSQLTITVLQKELKSRNLPIYGRKDALIQRLIASDNQEEIHGVSPGKRGSPSKSPRSPSRKKESDLIDDLIENPKVGHMLEALEENPLLMSKGIFCLNLQLVFPVLSFTNLPKSQLTSPSFAPPLRSYSILSCILQVALPKLSTIFGTIKFYQRYS